MLNIPSTSRDWLAPPPISGLEKSRRNYEYLLTTPPNSTVFQLLALQLGHSRSGLIRRNIVINLNVNATTINHSISNMVEPITTSFQAVVLSGIGVILCAPIPLGCSTTHEGKHVHWSEFKIFVATNSKLL